VDNTFIDELSVPEEVKVGAGDEAVCCAPGTEDVESKALEFPTVPPLLVAENCCETVGDDESAEPDVERLD